MAAWLSLLGFRVREVEGLKVLLFDTMDCLTELVTVEGLSSIESNYMLMASFGGLLFMGGAAAFFFSMVSFMMSLLMTEKEFS